MSYDSEQEVRLQFLEEAHEYLDQIESGLLGIGSGGVDRQQVDAVLRAAHSIKGGGALMGFMALSQLAHRMEDFFKVIKVGKVPVDGEIESMLLTGMDLMRQVAGCNQQGNEVDQSWLESHAQPILEALHERLGDPTPEDEAAMLSAEVGEDMAIMLFETEVEDCLQRLEAQLATATVVVIVAEFESSLEELAGLAEMLDFEAFHGLCQSIRQTLQSAPLPQQQAIATLGLQELQRSQAMVLVGQKDAIPTCLDLSGLELSSDLTSTIAEPELSAADPCGNVDLNLDAFELDSMLTEARMATVDLQDLSADPLDVELDVTLEATLTADVTSPELSPENLPSSVGQPAAAVGSWSEISESDILAEDATELLTSLQADHQVRVEVAAPPRVAEKKGDRQPISTSAKMPIKAPGEATPSEGVQSTIRVPVGKLNQLNELFGELIIERNGLQMQLKQLRELTNLLKQRVRTLDQSNVQLRSAYDRISVQDISDQRLPVMATASGVASPYQLTPGLSQDNSQDSTLDLNSLATINSEFDLLEMDRYSEMHLLSQALMEAAVQIQEVTSDIDTRVLDAEQATRGLSRTSKLIQTSMTQVRMRPVSELLSRFPRVLRDLGLQHGKQVELKIMGGSTLVDRSILEALNDPLIHLIRNCFDHGIESPEERLASNKSATGTIEIRAAYRGNQTFITISDDGGGINLDKIKGRALQMGLNAADLDKASNKDLLDLIFEPGFSTATEVTDLSGRGVGMDVVRTNLQAVRGSITVNTQIGRGTSFTIAVPFTLSVIRVLLVEAANMMLAFPTDVIEEMLLLKPEMVLNSAGAEVLNWDGEMVPLIRLEQWLNLPRKALSDREETPTINAPTALMIADGHELVAIQVERYWSEQEVTIRQTEGNLLMPNGFAGCTILGDGRVVPLVDALGLLNWINDQNNDLPKAAESLAGANLTANNYPDTHSGNSQPMIMVVDDSVNVRRFLALTLEKVGYRVEQAKDGQHALEKLETGLPIQGVICDIEMPRLDGYGFLAHVKSKPEFKGIPVAMLTSRSGEKHRRLAMSLGAAAYFCKPFREKELLETLKQFTQA